MQAFRKGDLVAVEGVVSFEPFDSACVLVELPGQFHATSFQAKHLSLVRPYFAAGEDVVFADDPDTDFTIVAANGDWAWLRCGDGADAAQGFIVPLRDLRPALAARDATTRRAFEAPTMTAISPQHPGYEVREAPRAEPGRLPELTVGSQCPVQNTDGGMPLTVSVSDFVGLELPSGDGAEQ